MDNDPNIFSYSVVLTSVQQRLFTDWETKQHEKVADIQQKKRPNYGTNGPFSWIITPTLNGTMICARNNITYDIIDLTDYGSW